MKIGIQEAKYRQFGDDRFKVIASYGYEAVDYDMSNTNSELYESGEAEFEARLLKDKALAEAAGLEISQVHGPWRWPVCDYTEEDRAERMEKMQRSIRGCAILGCKHWVIHPIMPMGVADVGTPDEQKTWDMNVEFMSKLLKAAKEQDVIICFENMPMQKLGIGTPAETLRFVKEMNDDHFKICFDTGHAAIFSNVMSVGDAVRMMGDEIKCFHIHDNNGWADIHLMPMTGVINWKDFAAALKDINFRGVFSLETGPASGLPEDVYNDMNGIFYRVARHIAGQVDG